MSEYQLELKQIVDYPRCRIYRQFIRTLMEDRSIRVSGCSGLFYFAVLCSFANFRTSYRRIDGISYTVYPGEWICRLDEMRQWFRCRFQHQTVSVLDSLQARQLITYSMLGRDKVVKFKICGWKKHNTVLEYNAPCQKDTGFFFLPISTANELVSLGKCSEADILLDLWINAVYNDAHVQGSDIGPVVYMRNGTGSPLIGYSELALRWGISKSTAGRLINKLADMEYLSLVTFPGSHGSVIYLNSYLSTMFQISDVMVDKDEVAMALSIKLSVSDDEPGIVTDEQISVPEELNCVPESHIRRVINKVAEILSAQGFSCCDCPKSLYKLSPFSGCREDLLFTAPVRSPDDDMLFTLSLACGDKDIFLFEIRLSHVEDRPVRRNG